MVGIEGIVERTIEDFCFEFLARPYLCYTEHGLHALFYARLLESIPESRRRIQLKGEDICIVQKEYPMLDKQEETKRAHWDIAVLDDIQVPEGENWYDMLGLNSIIEFGLNERIGHLKRDVLRLSHGKSGTKRGYIVHLHRFSKSITRRDWVRDHAGAASVKNIDDVLRSEGRNVTAYFAAVDTVRGLRNGPWRLDGQSGPLLLNRS